MPSLLVRLATVALLCLTSTPHAQAADRAAVGYQHLTMPDPAGPPVEVGIWYPSDAAPAPGMAGLLPQVVAVDGAPSGRRRPLVVMSHGNGGVFSSHTDTALALARAGYVVAALTHTGDNYRDQSRAVDVVNRPRQLKLLVDYMLGGWSGRAVIDPARVGAFGFSAGGFTVLAAAGGEPDLTAMRPHCAAHPAFYDCQLMSRFPQVVQRLQTETPIWTHDDRIRAVVAAAPAFGFAFGRPGLAGVRAPVQLWAAEFDHILPVADYTAPVRADLPQPPDYHLAANADHYDFLAPCSDALRRANPDICASRPGFDRIAFHADFDQAVVAFFDAHLKP